MKKEAKVLATWIMCPDGTMLPSFHRHDYRTHTTIDEVKRVHPDGIEEPDPFENRWEWIEWNKEAEDVIISSRGSMVDGGPDAYSRRGGVFTEMSVYDDDPYEVIRRFLCRGGRGKEGKDPLTNVPLFRISDEWLKKLIQYEANFRPKNMFLPYYQKEVIYRKENNITVKES